jgi:hypothetical protein
LLMLDGLKGDQVNSSLFDFSSGCLLDFLF